MNVSTPLVSTALASVRSQALAALSGSPCDFNSLFGAALSSQYADAGSATADLLSSFIRPGGAQAGVLHAGRNMALSDPESAYKMMTLINNRDVLYKAQYAELSRMGAGVAKLQEAGASLGTVTTVSAKDDIKTGLQDFVTRYNEWVQHYNPDMQGGGMLAGTQAAQMSRYELEQSVKNVFNGAGGGVHGMGDLGVSVDPVTGALALDAARLDAMLSANKQGAVDTLQEFSANFASSASLLNAHDNFIPRQLDNLNRAIHYIADNNTALRAEFGTGDTARPTGQVAQALAAYQQSVSLPALRSLA